MKVKWFDVAILDLITARFNKETQVRQAERQRSLLDLLDQKRQPAVSSEQWKFFIVVSIMWRKKKIVARRGLTVHFQE